jgi:ubiquitin C-terminal hydrolase
MRAIIEVFLRKGNNGCLTLVHLCGDAKFLINSLSLCDLQGEPVFYQLYGLIVHSGRECGAGHYYCYVRLPNNVWYILDDERVCSIV